MSTQDAPRARGTDAVRAAEYVLGLLPDAERREVEAQAMVDPLMRGEVAFWRARFAELAEDEAVSVAPPPQLKTWTETHVFGGDAPKAARKRRAPRRPGRLRAFFWGAVWGGVAMAMVAAAFVAAQTGMRLPVDLPEGLLPDAGPAHVAHVTPPGGDLIAILRTTGAEGAGLLEILPLGDIPEGSRLWLLPDAGEAIDLGVTGGITRASLPLSASVAGQIPSGRLALSTGDTPPTSEDAVPFRGVVGHTGSE